MDFYDGELSHLPEKSPWPSLTTTSEKLKDKPVIFIAVCSGKSRKAVMEYAKAVGCKWPMIADTDRSFEKLALDREISLHNITQLRLINPEGEFEYVSMSRVAEVMDPTIRRARTMERQAGRRAREPQARLAECRVWQLFGGGSAGAKVVVVDRARRESGRRDAPGQDSAGLQLAIGSSQGEPGQGLEVEGVSVVRDPRRELSRLRNACRRARDPPKAGKRSPESKKELGAMQSLDRIKNTMATAKPTARKQIVTSLEKLVKDKGDTVAGEEAKALLARINGGGK